MQHLMNMCGKIALESPWTASDCINTALLEKTAEIFQK